LPFLGTIISVAEDNWLNVCNEADLGQNDRKRLWKMAVLNPYCFEGWRK
jgi:hypothetical protein